MDAREIEVLLQQNGSGCSGNEHGGDGSEQPAGDCERRTALLLPVLSACKEAWASGSEALDAMAQKLGDGSRDGESGLGAPRCRACVSEPHDADRPQADTPLYQWHGACHWASPVSSTSS